MHELDTRRRSDGGQAVLLVVVLVAMAALALTALARLAAGAADAARARSAADAVALAGVASGRSAAQSIAAVNGASIVDYQVLDGDVVVRVRVGPATATARSRLDIVAGP